MVSIADATLASPQHERVCGAAGAGGKFQSQTRRLLPRNGILSNHRALRSGVSIADATLASPQRHVALGRRLREHMVSIADATLASPQRRAVMSSAPSIPVSIA